MAGLNGLFVTLCLLLSRTAFAADPLCPEAGDIAPCVCTTSNADVTLNCAFINSEDDLTRIFSAVFPTRSIKFLAISNSAIRELTNNVFGNTTFQYVQIDTKYLESIGDEAFLGSVDTLQYIHVSNCPIINSKFPFATLGQYTKLVDILFTNNALTSFPDIASETLRTVRILNNGIQVLPNGALHNLPVIDALTLNDNILTTVEDGAFETSGKMIGLYFENNKLQALTREMIGDLPDLTHLSFSGNEIYTIDSDSFTGVQALKVLNLGNNSFSSLDETFFRNNSALEALYLEDNYLSFIAPNTFASTPVLGLLILTDNLIREIESFAFTGLSKASIYLDKNQITSIGAKAFEGLTNKDVHLEDNRINMLYEYWARDLLDGNNQIIITGNPITCGCEISWLFENPSYQPLVTGQCPDGTYVSELNPDYFANNC